MTKLKFLVLLVVFFVVGGCTKTSFDTGWSHNCTMICTNVSTGQQEDIQRVGKNADHSAVCKETRVTCSAGRSAACVNAANAVNANEPLYNNCTSTSFGQCTEGCARN
jgi:hypothetical protein